MASDTSNPSPVLSAQVVASAFVEQYYQVLYKCPKEAHKFYRDSSVMSRLGSDGTMTSVTTIQDINDKIMSLDYKDYPAEIISADAQDSLTEGVIVLVTGCLTGKDNATRNFTQLFFLARQDKGYYVLNDVFRFVDVHRLSSPSAVNDTNENASTSPLTQDLGHAHVSNQPKQSQTSTPAEGFSENGGNVCDKSDINPSVVEEVAVAKLSASQSQNDVPPAADLASSVEDDAPKMSYASIVAKKITVTSTVHVSTGIGARVAPSVGQQSQTSASPKAAAPPPPHSKTETQNSNFHVEDSVPGKGIYIGNLPTDTNVEQLLGVVEKFGTVRHNGIQIRRYEDGFCFGFVEFESSDSVRSAIEANKITVGDKEAYIVEKKSATRAGNGKGRFSSGRGGFHNGNFRGNGNGGEGRSQGRYEYGNRGEFSGQARGRNGPNGRNGEAHRRGSIQNGGEVTHRGGMK